MKDFAQKILKLVNPLVPFAVAITLIGFCYTAVQQSLRMSANDPQIWLAGDAARVLARGGEMKTVLPTNVIDISESLSPYIAIFDNDDKLIASGATLHEEPIAPPHGVFEYAKKFGENRFTWQPEPEIRQAVVLVHFNGKNSGFVMSGRSLNETENRIDNIGKFALLTLLAVFILNFLAVVNQIFRPPDATNTMRRP